MEANAGKTAPAPPVRVCVIGCGPVGLEAALALSSLSGPTGRGVAVTIIESGAMAGAAIRGRWGHVPLFSPWKLNQSAAARKVVPGEPPPAIQPMPNSARPPLFFSLLRRHLTLDSHGGG